MQEEAEGTSKLLKMADDPLNNSSVTHGLESTRLGSIKYGSGEKEGANRA